MDELDFLQTLTPEELRGFTDGIWGFEESPGSVYTDVREPMILPALSLLISNKATNYSLDEIAEDLSSDNTGPGILGNPLHELFMPLSRTGMSARVEFDMTARRPGSADGTRPANQKDTIVSPPSRAQSCPSLAMSSIHSIQYKPAPLLAISSTSVCYEEVPKPSTSTTSLAERKDTVPSVSITSLGVGLDPVGASPVPPISTDNVVVKPTPLPVEFDDSMSLIHSEPAMKSTSFTSKHTAGSGPIARAPPTVQDHSNVLCSTSPTQPHVSRSSRTIDFEELKQMAAAAKISKPSNEASVDNTTVVQEISPRLSKNISSTSSALSASDPDLSKAVMSESGNVRSRLSGSSGGRRIKKNKSLLKDHGHSQDDAIVVDDSSDNDHGETAQQDPDEHRDLMELAYLDDGQAPTEKHEQSTLNSNQRRSPKRARSSPSRPGFIQWKGPVDSRLEIVDNLWLKTQAEWISLHHDTKKYTGALMTSFDKKICSAAKKFSSGGLCASDVLTLEKSWGLTYSVASTQLEEKQHKRQIKQFKITLHRLGLASRGLQEEDFAMEGDDEDDMEWTPGTKPKRRRVE
ncbi:uncharacterized protein ALTATR162_LOCUS2175 [Alternaria atra]|uniref:Uncharacterized protein n=1 Tax=Alternaria atra TaxID=119953 RepID=A0A8J2HWQ8_9PLEO|nr:uncharacterized protein ALTATR162_LOCUS2175 [Alternaria atra]CAG5148262.1 unnamed protein product [Alternaria atra]